MSYAERQQDELESLRSIYGDIFKDVTPQSTVWSRAALPHFQISLHSHENTARPLVSLVLDVEFTLAYPAALPIVKVLHPVNLLRSRLALIEQKIHAVLDEFKGEEVCFTMIMDVKEMLDLFQQTTDEVLSLDEERHRRIEMERRQLEQHEHEARLQEQLAKHRQKLAANAEMNLIRDDYKEHSSEPTAEEVAVPLTAATFVFDNVLTGEVPHSSAKFRFRAVQGFIRATVPGLLASVAKQYIVTPYVPSHEVEVSYLLTVVELNDAHWRGTDGKAEIRSLELELEQALDLNSDTILRLVGFQIDQETDPSKWTIRLLTDFSMAQQCLDTILHTADSVNWGLARTWLIQLLPALEYLHDKRLPHRLICPMSVSLNDSKLKLCHPAYGYSIVRMANLRKHDFMTRFIPKGWSDPDPSGPMQTDTWQLGVLFARIMINYDIQSQFRSPEHFLTDFSPKTYPGAEHYADRVYDLLSKMLQAKLSKRSSLLELNAVKFFRSGIDMDMQPAKADFSRDTLGTSRYQKLALDAARRNTHIEHPAPVSPNVNTVSVSRYDRDFEEVGKLGKGGFGEVVKARNRMEGTFYAIKKIKHRSNKLETLLSEVLSLARLNHQFIVRYYGCWVESLNEDAAQDDDEDFDSGLIGRSSSFFSHDSFQVDYLSNSLDPYFDDRIVFGNSTESDSSTVEESVSASVEESKASDVSTDKFVSRSILYIQMEFCENNTLLDLIESGLPANSSEYWRLFRQILEAVSYIHGSGFIHRDLKPTNIFIDKSNNIKVGDFGLAKNSQFLFAVAENNQVANRDLSTVVGTFFYTANEVATGEYDEKVDMYSIGVIFFEMCYQLGTGMERARVLNNLRLASVEFPDDFSDLRAGTEKRIIRQLLSHDPAERPGASELLNSGVLPIEHQDKIIREALRLLADPASPWQQQVRETLFKQPYLLARDLLFDNYGKNSHSNVIEHTVGDSITLSSMLEEMFRVFRNHGAVHDYSGSSVVPKQPVAQNDVYELLDKSGAVLMLSYDLVLPLARFMSRHTLAIPKLFRHEFVYRPSVRGVGVPEKYSAVSFDICSSDRLADADAECVKVLDEILQTFSCFQLRGSQTVLVVNHLDILHSVLDFAFGHTGVPHGRKYEILAVLSQLGIERGPEEIKAYLRNDFKIQHTVVKDLVDVFNITAEPAIAAQKLRKILVDLPLLMKVERALEATMTVLASAAKLGIQTPVVLCPLSNYNARYYDKAFMMQVLHRIENRKFVRVATGGRYDKLVELLSNEGLSSARRQHATGVQLSLTLVFVLMKASLKRAQHQPKWRQPRCDVLVTGAATCEDSVYMVMRQLWANNVLCDVCWGSVEELLARATADGCLWAVYLKQPHQRKKKSLFRPVRVRCMATCRDTDVEYDQLLLLVAREKEHVAVVEPTPEPLYSVDIDQRVSVVANVAPRGRKNNKREKWELENDAQLAAAHVVKDLARAPVVSVDLPSPTLDVIATALLNVPFEEWFKKLFFANSKLARSYANGIHDALRKEAARGTRWAMVHSTKTDYSVVVDLQR